MELVGELGRADATAILAPGVSALKKAHEAIRGGAAALRELIDRAIDSVERDGIAYTSDLERALSDTMNGICRELVGALLTSEAAADLREGPAAGERNGGTHTRTVTTLLGPVGPVPRAYYPRQTAAGTHSTGG